MSEPIKMTESEIAEIRMLQEKFQEKIVEFGKLYLQKMQVEASIKSVTDQETKLREDWVNLQKLENDFVEKLLQKYGEGALDIKAGVFLPEKKTTT